MNAGVATPAWLLRAKSTLAVLSPWIWREVHVQNGAQQSLNYAWQTGTSRTNR